MQGLGESFRVSDVFALRPSVSIPVDFDDANTVIGLGPTIGFRRR